MISNKELFAQKKIIGEYVRRLRLKRPRIRKIDIYKISGLKIGIQTKIESGGNYHIDSYIRYKLAIHKIREIKTHTI